MTKMIIGSLVGALILFLWQFISWTLAPVHKTEYGYTEMESEILSSMEGLEHGSYMLPGTPPGTTMEDEQARMEANADKPWAYVHYRPSMDMGMGMKMFRGYASNFVAVLLLCWVLVRIGENNMKTTLMASLAVGLVGFCTVNYIQSIWFETDTWGHLVDVIVGWGLTGAWLGWWLNR